MIRRNVNVFIEHTTFEECAVMYKGTKYFFNGIMYDDVTRMYSYKTDIWDINGYYEKTIFNEQFLTVEECIEKH